MKNTLYRALLASALFGCSGGKTTDSDLPDGAGPDVHLTFPYTVSGTGIILPARVDTSHFCNGSEMETNIDSIESDTLPFSVSGTSLVMITRTDTIESGVVIQLASELTRSGSGTGLIGTWKDQVLSYQVISGALTQEEKDDIDAEMASRTRLGRFDKSSVTFTENAMVLSVDFLTAERFLYEWNEEFFPGEKPDSAKYDITVKITGQYTVELHGNMTGETVRIKILPNGDRTYTSSVIGHPESRYVESSKTCPNDYEPLWYATFRYENSLENGEGPAAKSGENGQKSRQPPHFPFFPLKPASIFLN